MKHKSVLFSPMSPRGASFFFSFVFGLNRFWSGIFFVKTKHSEETINVNVNNKAQRRKKEYSLSIKRNYKRKKKQLSKKKKKKNQNEIKTVSAIYLG